MIPGNTRSLHDHTDSPPTATGRPDDLRSRCVANDATGSPVAGGLDLAAADLGADAADTAEAINPGGSTAGRNTLADDLTQTRGMTATPAFVARSMLTIARMPSTSEDDDKWCGQLIALLNEQYEAGKAESGAPDLLAALDELLYHRRYPSGFLSQRAITRNAKIEAAARAAIAKATGKIGGGA